MHKDGYRWNSLARFVADLSIKTKLLFLFLLFSVILVLGVGIVSYESSSRVVDKQTVVYSKSLLEQFKDRVDDMRDEVLKASIPIVINPSVQNNELKGLEIEDLLNRQYDINSDMLLTLSQKKYIGSIYLCSESGIVISTENLDERDQKGCKTTEFYHVAFENVTEPVWIGVHNNEFARDTNKEVFTFARTLYNKETFRPFGVLAINLPASVLDDIGGKSVGNLIIADRSGSIVYEGSGASSGEERGYLDDIANGAVPSGTFDWSRGKDKYKIQYNVSKQGDWIYIAEVPIDYLLQNSAQVKKSISVVLITGIVMSVAASYLISSYFTIPLRRMILTMRRVQKGDFRINLDIRNRSEIGQLADSYKIMVAELKEHIDTIKLEARKKRDAELNALQAQITPHFLYNTLNSIKIMARLQKMDGIEELTSALIELLQMSISHKSTFITIEQELDMVKKYVLLRNYRSGNRYSVEFDYSEEVLSFMTVKLSLQPIIENAINHGLEPKSGKGNIRISVRKEYHDLKITVDDNGIGMNAEQIAKIWSEERSGGRQFSGIGIRNIHERFVMQFGSEYGIVYDSVPGQYTRAVLTLPAFRESEADRYV
ncbi:sensor histidine kinase [Cohnella fermenti]|nr:sensor histidine kinase [Cohnella fermenti]